MLLMAMAGRRTLHPGDGCDMEDEPVDPPEWVYTYPPDRGDSMLVSATLFTDRPPCETDSRAT